jgi:hypothetical protein
MLLADQAAEIEAQEKASKNRTGRRTMVVG